MVRPEAAVAIVVAALLAGSANGCGGSGSQSGPGSGSGSGGGGGHTAAAPQAAPSRPKRLQVTASPHHLSTPVSGEAVVRAGKNLLVIGGLDESDVSVAAVTKFDPTTGAARSAGKLAEPLHDIAATALPGGVLVFGGGSVTTTAEVQRLVPGGAGEAVGRLPVPRSDLSAVTLDGAAYLLAGYDGERAVGNVLKTSDGSTLETVAKLPIPVRYAAVAVLGPTIFVVGGEESSGADSTAIQAFDTRTDRASVIGHLPAPLAHASAVVLDGRIYVLGGRLNGSTTEQILRLNPSKGTAKRAGRLPEPIQNAAAAAVGQTGYLLGGLTPEEVSLSSVVVLKLVP